MKDLIDTAEAARYLGVAEQTLANWRWRSVGPRWFTLGRRVRYDRNELDAWIEGRASTAGKEPAA